MADAKRIQGKIDFSTWHFPGVEITPWQKIIHAFSGVIREQFRETPPDIYISTYDKTGPLRIRVNIPVGPDENGTVYAITLSKIVDEIAEMLEESDGKIREEREIVEHIVRGLRNAAQRLERRIKK